jgi:hypothetical protein
LNKTPDIAFLKAFYRNSAVLQMEFFYGQNFFNKTIGSPKYEFSEDDNFVFTDPLLLFGKVKKTNAQCTSRYLSGKIAQATPQAKICKRVQFPYLQASFKHLSYE